MRLPHRPPPTSFSTKLFPVTRSEVFSHALLELVDSLFVRDGFLMSHLQPFSITHLCRFFNKNRRIHSDFSIPSALFQEATAMESTTAVVTVVAFTNVWRPNWSVSMLFHTQTESNSSNAQLNAFLLEKTQKDGGRAEAFCYSTVGHNNVVFFSKKTTKLKETTTSKTLSFCWCNICTESFGIRFLYVRPSTTCDL